MSPQKPYLYRAIYDWIVDNGLTPYLLVNTLIEGVQVPEQFIHDGKIVLNIDPGAVRNYHADNEWISFSARFSGKPMELFIPLNAVQSIYCKENNQGMFFPEEENSPPPETSAPSSKVNKTGLKLVK